MESLTKHRDLKLDERRNELVPELNYDTTKWFSKYFLATEMKKIKAKMIKPVYLGLLKLEISKITMYEFWYDYIKPKNQNNEKRGYR